MAHDNDLALGGAAFNHENGWLMGDWPLNASVNFYLRLRGIDPIL